MDHFLNKVLEKPRYGYLRDGTLYIPTVKELFKHFDALAAVAPAVIARLARVALGFVAVVHGLRQEAGRRNGHVVGAALVRNAVLLRIFVHP